MLNVRYTFDIKNDIYSRGYAGVPSELLGPRSFSSNIKSTYMGDQEKHWHMVWIVVSLAKMARLGAKRAQNGPNSISHYRLVVGS